MSYTKVISKVFLLCVLFGCLSYARSLEGKLKRSRRQAGDTRIAEYMARLALERKIGCIQIGCGLIDIQQSGKKKRGGAADSGISDSTRTKLLTMLLEDSPVLD